MITKASLILFMTAAFCTCKKSESPSNPTPVIDVSQQWLIDQSGNVMSVQGLDQWQYKNFSSEELSLFESLDTFNLTGTTTPDSVIQIPGQLNYAYPNPFTSSHRLHFEFTNGYSGDYVFKYVVVDSLLRAVDEKGSRMYSGANNLEIIPNIPVGKFRLYYTLSSKANAHFFKCWGNIQKTQ